MTDFIIGAMQSVTYRTPERRAVGGFTLIELMTVVVVIAILAVIALPAYTEYIRKSRRAEAITLINQIAQAQERWRANNTTYSSDLSAAGINVNSSTQYYVASIPAAASSSYTVWATATGSQAADLKCTRLTWTMTGGNIAASSVGTAASTACWSR